MSNLIIHVSVMQSVSYKIVKTLLRFTKLFIYQISKINKYIIKVFINLNFIKTLFRKLYLLKG